MASSALYPSALINRSTIGTLICGSSSRGVATSAIAPAISDARRRRIESFDVMKISTIRAVRLRTGGAAGAALLRQPVDGVFFDICFDVDSFSRDALAAMRARGVDPHDAAARARFAHDVNWARAEEHLALGGVRIEDNILVTAGEPENLTQAIPK